MLSFKFYCHTPFSERAPEYLESDPPPTHTPEMKTGESVFKLLSTGAIGHPPETGAIPVQFTVGQHYPVLLVSGQGRHRLRVVDVLLRDEDRNVLTYSGCMDVLGSRLPHKVDCYTHRLSYSTT